MITPYRLLAPFFVLLLPPLALLNRKVRSGLRLRLRRRETPHFNERPLWIHAASGEFEYAKAVIRELKARRPELPIVVTYFSPTYADNVAAFPGVDYAEPLPLDLPGPARGFLERVRPRACLVARTDFWPEVLTQAGRLGIPRVVFAYTQRPVTGLKRYVTRARLSLVDEVLTVGAVDRDAVRAVAPAARVSALGDPRYDQVAHRLAHPRPLPDALTPKGPTLVAGSTWAADEAVLLPGLAPLLKAGRLRLILVPHEPTPAHLAHVERTLRALGLTWRRFSEGAAWGEHPVLLVDRTGVLAELYAWGEFAYVGGGFGRGVHSVMEALGTGALTLVGPRHRNNREAVEFSHLEFHGCPGVGVVATADDVAEALLRGLTHPDRAGVRRAVRAEFDGRRGAAAVIAARWSSADPP